MCKTVKRFAQDETASVTAGYGLIAAGLSLAIVALLQGIGIRLTMSLAGASGSLP
jgi:pilus assembly protein Flp/PilA